MAYDTIVHNATLITMDPDTGIIDGGWIGIRDGTIRAVASALRPPLEGTPQIIDADGGIVMPGLVNTHTHLPMALFRGLADDLPLDAWLNEHIFPAEARAINADNVRWGTLLACAEMLLAGTTCCCDGYFLEQTVAQAVTDTGMRAVLGQGVIDLPAPGVPDPATNVDHAVAYARAWQSRHPRITPSIFCHAPYTCSDATLIRAKQAADRLGIRFQVHAAETRREREQSLAETGASPVARLAKLGVLDRRTLLAHCVWLDDDDIDIMADSGCAVAHCPESNMKLASGIAPLPRLQTAGIPVGLGTDGCASNNDLDLFGEMATTARLHKVATGDPTVMDAASVLHMATAGGAAAIGLAEQIGSLTIGKRADLIVVDTRTPHLTPIYHPESHIVYAAARDDVRHVLIDGRTVVRDRAVLTIDIAEVIQHANRIAREIQAGDAG